MRRLLVSRRAGGGLGAGALFLALIGGTGPACRSPERPSARRATGLATDGSSNAPHPPGARPGDRPPQPPRPGCVTFVGDVKLSQVVAREVRARPRSPWAAFRFPPGEAWVGNLEGPVIPGPGARCRKPPHLCLGIAPADLAVLRRAPFVAMSLANNHVLDYGHAGRRETERGLRALGIRPLGEGAAPVRLRIGGRLWAFVPLSLVGRAPGESQLALERARLQLGLAAASTRRVVALVHWGIEHQSEPTVRQRRVGRLLRAWGAALVIGAGAHVVQPARCEGSGAVYFGLGNHLFDQRGARERRGLMVRCCPGRGGKGLHCRTQATGRSRDSTFPRPVPAVPGSGGTCNLAPGAAPLDRTWERHPAAGRFVFVQPFPALGEHVFFALHRSHSTIDGEVALRPYVFRMEGGRHRDLWSGSALARPLVAARLISTRAGPRLCALHRADSFLKLDPRTRGRRRIVYRWSGFGFSGVHEPDATRRCAQL